jgi:hypothetical protein
VNDKKAMKSQLGDQEYLFWSTIGDVFDEAYYLATNPDVAESGMDARLHYLRTGWQEGRNPNSWFDNDYYLRVHGDVAAANMNPLLHYVWQGRPEGRVVKRPHDRLRTLIETAQPSHHRARDFPAAAPSPPENIDELIREVTAVDALGLVVSFGHDDYAENTGGVQRLTGEEAADFAAAEWRYLHLSPGRPLPMLSDERDLDQYIFSLRLDGRSLGPARATQIVELLAHLGEQGTAIDFVIHHLMGHSPEIVAGICTSVENAEVYFWVHDFYTLCTNFNLLRNNWKYCNAPHRESVGCRICAYGVERSAHLERVQSLFEMTEPCILAPSEAALGIWRNRSGLIYSQAHVVPIGRIVFAQGVITPGVKPAHRIGFIGYESHAKGWTAFQALLDRFGADTRFEFFRLGADADAPTGDSRYRHVRVCADQHDRDAMTRAIAENGIDGVLLWPAWPETFCYVAHEVLAAGSVLITHSEAGNVPAVIRENAPEQGVILEDMDALYDLFESNDKMIRVLSQPRRHGLIVPHQNAAHVALRRHVERRDRMRLTAAERSHG